MAVTLSADVLYRYERFSLYNSPYVAHDHGCAIDLYPGTDTEIVPSPVRGTVLDTREVNAPPKPYAAEHDHLILLDCGERVARTLHVDPAVEPGDQVEVGDSLGTLVRAGFFAPWVDNHVHLGFRVPDANPYRAAGSLPIVPEVDVEALDWDGSGTVVERGDTYAILDAPAHPSPGEFVGIAGSLVPRATDACEATDAVGDASREDEETGTTGTTEGGSDGTGVVPVVLDGGLPHYDGGGALRTPGTPATPDSPAGPETSDGQIQFLDTEIGVVNGRDVAWQPISVRANDRPITGLSLFCARDRGFGAKLVCPDESFERGEHVTVSIRSVD